MWRRGKGTVTRFELVEELLETMAAVSRPGELLDEQKKPLLAQEERGESVEKSWRIEVWKCSRRCSGGVMTSPDAIIGYRQVWRSFGVELRFCFCVVRNSEAAIRSISFLATAIPSSVVSFATALILNK
jgi:hypothetical protein